MQLIIGTNSILTVSLSREIWMSEENEEEKWGEILTEKVDRRSNNYITTKGYFKRSRVDGDSLLTWETSARRASSKGRHVKPFKARACKTNYYADYPQKKPNKRTIAHTMTQRWLDRDGWIDRQIVMQTFWLINCSWQQGKKTLCDYWLKCQSLQPLVSQLSQVTCPGRERQREKE